MTATSAGADAGAGAGLLGRRGRSRITRHVDQPVWRAAVAHRPESLETVVQVVTTGGSVVVVSAATLVLCAALLESGHEATAVGVLTAMVGAQVTSDVLKALISRARPPAGSMIGEPELSYSFPSAHSSRSMALSVVAVQAVTALAPGLRAPAIGVAATYALLVGTSRVHLGVHWPTDVLAGWALGAACAALGPRAASTWDAVRG